MRILRFLFSSFLIIGVIVAVLAFAGRELLLLWGTSTVRSSVTELQSISRNATEYARMCRQKGTPADQVAVERLQLRFISPTEYVLEVLCAQFTLDPIVIKTQKLPLFVEKLPGSAGIIWGEERSGVTLGTFGRQASVVVENRIIGNASGNVSLGTFPVSSCTGYGYQCCQAETQSGVGDPFTQVNDCPKSCYSQCVVRPIILSFVSDPFPDVKTRTVTVARNNSVDFTYVASYESAKKQPLSLLLDYGDGTNDVLNTLTGAASHTYTCTTSAPCHFTAKISARTVSGIGSADTAITQLKIVVQ